MRRLFSLQALGLLCSLGRSAPSLEAEIAPRELQKRAPTCNTPDNRACWSDGFDINTDYEVESPDTGVTVTYEWTISEFPNYVGGDGLPKDNAFLINGQFPGPTVRAQWGDWVEVKVTNNLTCDGTSIHWHGIHMRNNVVNDGANGVTECPIPPGSTKTYRWRAEQYGTSWYHSHYSSQYGNGVAGTVVIEGPASANYDEDLGVFPITDWYYLEAEALQRSLIPFPAPAPLSDNIFFNGTHVNMQGEGDYYRVKLVPDKLNLLRLINPSVDNHFTVKLVDHDLTVIATDFVPVKPLTTPQLFMAPGQRYDVIIDASQTPGNYWFNVTFSSEQACGNSFIADVLVPAAIFTYDGVEEGLPTKPGTAPPDSKCEDDASYEPVLERTIPQDEFGVSDNNTIDVVLTDRPWEDEERRVYWDVHGHDMNITWGDPTLEYIAAGNLDFPERYNVHNVQGNYSFWLIENTSGLPHPMHLHGHDFFVMGRSPPVDSAFQAGMRNFDPGSDTSSLKWDNPTRRDTTMLPAKGWLVLGFRSDNPGAWLFHCHIAWHAGQGFSMEFVERVEDIPDMVDLDEIQPNCEAWESYYATTECPQFDSGL